MRRVEEEVCRANAEVADTAQAGRDAGAEDARAGNGAAARAKGETGVSEGPVMIQPEALFAKGKALVEE